MEQYSRGDCQDSFAVNAPKMPFRFLTKYQIHHDGTLNQLQQWKVEGTGEEGGALLPALSMLLPPEVRIELSFPKKNYPCMRWSTKWKSPWDRTLSTVNGTKRQAERSSSVWSKLFKTSLQWLHYCRHRSRCKGGAGGAVTVQLMCVDSAGVIYSLFWALLCWQTSPSALLACNR